MPRKSGLGKGLGALIPTEDTQPALSGVLQIPLEAISPNPRQPRASVDPQELEELAASITEYGILQPLIVRPGDEPDHYYLVAGERRWRAARMAGLDLVPAILHLADDRQQLELALVENLQRSNLAPLETAQAYQQLADTFRLSQDEIAQRVGKSRVTIANTLRLLKLPADVQRALSGGLITEGHARALLGLPNPAAQSAALQAIIARDLTVRQTEDLVKKLTGSRPASRPRKAQIPEIQALEERLRERLGTRVVLHHGPKGGSLVIHYYSDEELNSLIAQILEE